MQLAPRHPHLGLHGVFADSLPDGWGLLLQDRFFRQQNLPFYDVTYSPHPYNEHATAFGGFGKNPPLPTLQKLAVSAGYENRQVAREDIVEIADVAGCVHLVVSCPAQSLKEVCAAAFLLS